MTHRLYFSDSRLDRFAATVVNRSPDGLRIQLDRTAFYPTSGGQPFDTGLIAGLAVSKVEEEGGEIIHFLDQPLPTDLAVVDCLVDAQRRLDHMQQHTGQHLLSAVLAEDFARATVSFHMGADYSTIDIEPNRLDSATLAAVELRVNERLRENHQVTITFEDAATAAGLRKASDRHGQLRIVTIVGLDRSACGGTHLSHTGEIGQILLGKTEKVRGALRLEFYCGARATAQVRTRLDQAAATEAALRERLATTDKERKRLALEVAGITGQRHYDAAIPEPGGRRLWVEELEEIDEVARASATAFVLNTQAIVLLFGRSNGGVLFAAHPGLGIDCGKLLKAALDDAGGRGGGAPRMAQGSVPDAIHFPAVRSALTC